MSKCDNFKKNYDILSKTKNCKFLQRLQNEHVSINFSLLSESILEMYCYVTLPTNVSLHKFFIQVVNFVLHENNLNRRNLRHAFIHTNVGGYQFLSGLSDAGILAPIRHWFLCRRQNKIFTISSTDNHFTMWTFLQWWTISKMNKNDF